MQALQSSKTRLRIIGIIFIFVAGCVKHDPEVLVDVDSSYYSGHEQYSYLLRGTKGEKIPKYELTNGIFSLSDKKNLQELSQLQFGKININGINTIYLFEFSKIKKIAKSPKVFLLVTGEKVKTAAIDIHSNSLNHVKDNVFIVIHGASKNLLSKVLAELKNANKIYLTDWTTFHKKELFK